MKLLAKYNRVNIPITIVALLISSMGFYFIIHYVLIHQLDKDLRIEQMEIIHYVGEKDSLPETSDYKDQQIEFHLTSHDFFKPRFSTEDVFNKKENETESYRMLEFLITVNGKNYIAEVKKSQQETEDIVQMILMITLSVIIFLILILFIANRFLLASLWKPFHQTLEELKQFNLSSKNKINLPQTDINEFKELNETALSMTQKVNNDYELLKSFTENASHEIQTPLAIIKNKIELLSQSEKLDESQINVIQSINDATSRLSRLNQSLLLLAKIENRQFGNTEVINLSFVLNRCLENFEELSVIKRINIHKEISENIFIEMNESLAEILVSNIIINAIKHNNQGGSIKIELDSNGLTVSNTGVVPKISTSELFERFKKDSSSGDSLGLGLSIVKTICDTYRFDISYVYNEKMHIVNILFH
ncbi:MAG TPA: HAMP domain-containing sensor histidine kinase [Hanamia sp.]|nr:HAMP domain-containing sensor histidine kinase [Hanamia sp.]